MSARRAVIFKDNAVLISAYNLIIDLSLTCENKN